MSVEAKHKDRGTTLSGVLERMVAFVVAAFDPPRLAAWGDCSGLAAKAGLGIQVLLPGFVSAALLVLSFPLPFIWWLTFVGLVPLLVALFKATEWRQAFRLGLSCAFFFVFLGFGWVAFVATNFGGLPWIVGRIVHLLFCFIGECQLLFFALLGYGALAFARRLGRPTRAIAVLVGLPALYTGLDFLYPKIFPNTLGHVFYAWFSVAQIVEYTGAHALTFVSVAVSVAVAVLLVGRAGRPEMNLVAPKSAVGALLIVAIGLAGAHFWGKSRINELRALESALSRQVKIAAIQANIGDIDKLASERGFEPAVEHVLSMYREMSLAAVKDLHPDFLLWPETAYPFLYTHFADSTANNIGQARDQWIADTTRELKTPLFFGGYSAVGRRDFNTAFFVTPEGELIGQYRKSILLAFGEYIPLGPFAKLVQDLIPTIADFGRGAGPSVMKFKGVNFAPQICYEGIVPDHSRAAVELGADVLLNITNDSWFGDTAEPWLHFLLTGFRSIELRRPLVRGTNTGITALFDLTGHAVVKSRLFSPEIVDLSVKVPGKGQNYPQTFFAAHGEVFGRACAVWAAIVAFILAAQAILNLARRRSPGSPIKC